MEREYLDTDTFTFSATQGYSSLINDINDLSPAELSSFTDPEIRPRATSRSTPAPISSFIDSFDLHTPTVPDEVDLRALEYVQPPNENLICAICASPFVTPMELGCGHIFCKECLYDHLQSGIQSASRCPKCRRQVETLGSVSTLLGHLLDELEVECPNRLSGCCLHLKRYTIRDHVKQYCPFTEVPCSSSDCELFIERRYADQECLHSFVECEDCGEQIMEKDLDAHESQLCLDGFVECQYCSDEVRRVNLKTHNSQQCEMFPEACPGQTVGCSFFDIRKTAKAHSITCPMAIMAPHIAQRTDKHTQLQRENDHLRDQLANLETRLEEIEAISKQLSSTIKMERRRSMMPPEGIVSATRLEDLTSRVDDLATDYTSRLDNVTTDNARMHMTFINENIRSQQQFHTMNAAITALRAQVTHLVATRATGSSGNNGSNTAGARGGGVALDSGRREPPKL